MENYYPYTDTEIEAFNLSNKFKSLHKEYCFHKMRFERGLYGSAVTPEMLKNIHFFCEVLYDELYVLNEHRTLKEVEPMPPLAP